MLKTRYVCVALAIAWLGRAQAWAIPPNRVIQLEPDSSRFEKGFQGRWTAYSLDPEVVEAKAFKTAEVFLQAKGQGTTLVLLVNRVVGQVAFWQVRVQAPVARPKRPDLSVLQAPCNCGHGGGYPLRCTVASPACIKALRTFLRGSDLTTEDLRLTYTVESLQALLIELQPVLKEAGFAQVALAFSGVNLRMQGTLPDEAAWRRLVLLLYETMVGKLLLEDRIGLSSKGG